MAPLVQVCGDAEEVEDLVLEGREGGFEGLDDVVVVDEVVAGDAVEDLEDPGALGAGHARSSGYRGCRAASLHSWRADLSFDEGASSRGDGCRMMVGVSCPVGVAEA
ncbi:hypothetical protein [Iamia sp.]|uniref:hypothetical protein n=1 Tax=Iamia sp. TaxID=2722710 RepID=UPI002C3C92AA|nr:hypothetical protein [Iamia sp.]HXH59558.1 hypothetical protein [Iamia sp.]